MYESEEKKKGWARVSWYPIPGERVEVDKQLEEKVLAARSRAYVPYSHFPVGAVAVDQAGHTYSGANVENASYPLGMCAERVALFKLVTESTHAPQALYVIGDTEGPISPCGACRQVMVELCPPEMPVYLGNVRGEWIETTVAALLPGAFTDRDLG